jgi:arylsulfatase A-like enzyme
MPTVRSLALLLAAAGAAWPCPTGAPDRPNIIFILSDDYGIGGVGCYGAEYKTPCLDSLAARGTRFEHCFSAPLCGPSRSLCMFGRYAFRTGVLDNGCGAAATPQKEVCIARVLKEAGYATAIAGKWRQLAYFATKEDGRKWGWDEFLIWGGSADEKKGDRYWDPDYNRNGEPVADAKDKYGPDLLHEFVVDFIRRRRDGPFFVYYPTPLVHGPILRTPDSREGAGREALYADNVAYLDKLVGKLIDELEALKLREKTLIVFTGDNGSVGGGKINGRAIAGGKGSLREGGSRVPLIASWPGTTPAGAVNRDLVDFSDFYCTFAELAGAKLPGGLTLDSRSFAPQLRGEKGTPREWAYVQLGAQWYAREAGWKLNQAGQLFDLKDAPFVEAPVAADTKDEAALAARKRLEAVLEELDPAAGEASPGRKAGKAKRKKKEP